MAETALITGANRGIGKAIALRLASVGYNLMLLARNESALASVAAECTTLGEGEVTILSGELTDEVFARSAVEATQARFGRLDVLINNAGSALHESVQNADLPVWQGVMDINFNAVLYLSRYALPGMIEHGSGAVINISSISGRNTSAGSAIYSASKHALNGLSGCMYEDVRDFGIKVSTIMPGFVDTDLTQGLGMTANNMIRADDIADTVQYVLGSSASCCPTEIVLRPQQRP